MEQTLFSLLNRSLSKLLKFLPISERVFGSILLQSEHKEMGVNLWELRELRELTAELLRLPSPPPPPLSCLELRSTFVWFFSLLVVAK